MGRVGLLYHDEVKIMALMWSSWAGKGFVQLPQPLVVKSSFSSKHRIAYLGGPIIRAWVGSLFYMLSIPERQQSTSCSGDFCTVQRKLLLSLNWEADHSFTFHILLLDNRDGGKLCNIIHMLFLIFMIIP